MRILIGSQQIVLSLDNFDWSIGSDIRGLAVEESVREFKIMATANDKQWQKDAADQNFDYMFKLLIIGNSAVGKTSFLFRYADDSYTSAFVSTVGIDFKVKTVFRNEKRVKLQIWDTGWFKIFYLRFSCFYIVP